MNFFGLTDRGRVRAQNEDFLFASDLPVGELPDLFAVCDGMGGHNAGEIASEYAIEALLEYLRSSSEKDIIKALKNGVSFANATVFNRASEDPAKAGMGTTIVCAVLSGDRLIVMNVGDSRLYAVTDNSIKQITRDHSVVEELIRRGALSEDAAQFHRDRHKITRAVGAEERIVPDFFEVNMKKEGVKALLLCTDGLTNEVSDEEIFSIVISDRSIKERTKALIDAANSNRGADNVTALLVEPFVYNEVDING